MALRTGQGPEVPAGAVGVAQPALPAWAKRAARASLAILLGIGLWLVLRWAATAPPAAAPALQSFLADSGGGAIEVGGIYAPREYFRLNQRDPAALGLDPAREIIFFLLIDTHEHDEDLPDPATWWDGVSLRIDGEGGYRPWKKKLVLDSEHHQTIALAFPQRGETGGPLITDEAQLSLVVPDLGDGARVLEWHPLPSSRAPSPPGGGSWSLSLGALLPLLGGLLVAFSPCVVHMSTYYLPLFGAGVKGRLKQTLLVGLFTLGFTIPYTVAGVAVGYVGQFAKNSSLLGTLAQPLTWVAGAIVLFFGLQMAGVFHRPFLLRLNLPQLLRLERGRTGYLVSGFLGVNLAVGCLGCVGGSLFAALLFYSGAVGSPLEGGIILFLFALAANVPFFLAALTLGRLQLRNRLPLSVTRYAPLVSGAMLIALGLLILSGTESLVEDTLFLALGIGRQG